jgi:hypothetical protein
MLEDSIRVTEMSGENSRHCLVGSTGCRLDYLPQVERVYVCNGEQVPAAEFEVDALCALLARVSTRLLQDKCAKGMRLKVVR